MLTSTMNLSATSRAFSIYAKNVDAAARNLVDVLRAIKPTADDASLYRLYCLASRSNSYDSVSPALAQELRRIAAHE